MKETDATAKHTPGPWVVDLTGPFLLGGDSVPVEGQSTETGLIHREICTVLLDTDAYPEGKEFLEDCANARLIAAAPDLLEALKSLLSETEEIEYHSMVEAQSMQIEQDKARVAIAKAEGREVTP